MLAVVRAASRPDAIGGDSRATRLDTDEGAFSRPEVTPASASPETAANGADPALADISLRLGVANSTGDAAFAPAAAHTSAFEDRRDSAREPIARCNGTVLLPFAC